MKPVFGWLICSLFIFSTGAQATTISELSSDRDLGGGMLDIRTDSANGHVWLVLDQLPAEYIYVTALESGVGSNDLGLDRGQLGDTRLVRFERHGNKVLMIEPNLDYRAVSDNAAERRAVREAFAQSVLAGFDIGAESNGQVAIDLAPMLLTDATLIGDRIANAQQGSFALDPSRSAIAYEQFLNFPQNTLMSAILTFAGQQPGDWVSSVTPTPKALTVEVSHQFVALPEAGYQTRAYHPRSGYFPLIYRDYAVPLGQSLDQRLIYRHRITEGEPLIYYVDNGAPEPIRSALVEGAQWWADAFAAAGFPDLYQVEILPEDTHPLDVRYNVIQWVHRSTRGWSYGGSVSDPRTGEIIKGHVSLGSLRVRQDQLIAEALTAPFTQGNEDSEAAREMALARLRQLSAHEVGHTLGINHNFAASTNNDGSVMDYPHPNLYLNDEGGIGLDQAYRVGISEWDKLTVRYGYAEFPEGETESGLSAILAEAQEKGLDFIPDQDARVPGSPQTLGHLWDNGGNALQRLDELLEIRQQALENLSPAVIPAGTPLFEIERRLVPVYLLHRYQIEAVGKLLGGLVYDHRLRGDDATGHGPLDGDSQRRALTVLSDLLSADYLVLPENLHYLIPPAAAGYQRDREFFTHETGITFDHLAPARAAAQLAINELLQPQRLSRLEQQHALDTSLPDADTVIDTLLRKTWYKTPDRDSYKAAIDAEVNWLVLSALERLAGTSSQQIKGLALATLLELSDHLESKRQNQRSAQDQAALYEIQRFLYQTQNAQPVAPANPVPPGSPIGG